MKNPITWGWASLRERGFSRTVSSAVNFVDNWLFDWRYGTDTASVVQTPLLDIPSHVKAFAHEYRATKAAPMRQLMAAAELPEDKVFIDMGCGKGKALMIAADYGCRTLIGVESSPALCERAQANLQTHLKDRPEVSFDIVQGCRPLRVSRR